MIDPLDILNLYCNVARVLLKPFACWLMKSKKINFLISERLTPLLINRFYENLSRLVIVVSPGVLFRTPLRGKVNAL